MELSRYFAPRDKRNSTARSEGDLVHQYPLHHFILFKFRLSACSSVLSIHDQGRYTLTFTQVISVQIFLPSGPLTRIPLIKDEKSPTGREYMEIFSSVIQLAQWHKHIHKTTNNPLIMGIERKVSTLRIDRD